MDNLPIRCAVTESRVPQHRQCGMRRTNSAGTSQELRNSHTHVNSGMSHDGRAVFRISSS